MHGVVFLETSPSVLVAEMVSTVEASTGRTLYPAQIERLMVDCIAYRESLVRLAIQRSAEQCLVAFASGDPLEALGALVGVSRLPASPVTVTLRLTLSAPAGESTPFVSGWQALHGAVAFALIDSAVIPAGQLSVDVLAQAVVPGRAANDIPIGGGWTALEGAATVTSLTISAGGAEIETDDALRARIQEAPARFSAAGSAAAYRYHALSASPAITEVAVDSPSPGVVGVYPLTTAGLPTQPILDAVTAALNADQVRPICDLVQVQAPTRVPWILDATLTLRRSADAAQTLSAAQNAAEAFAADRRSGLGRDLVASQLIAALSVSGIYKVALNGWTDRVCLPKDWADCTTISLRLAPERADG